VGKSSVLNYALACCHQAGWLVVCMPYAADWTLGLGGRSMLWGNEAYRLSDTSYLNRLPPQLEGRDLYENPDASVNFLISHGLAQQDKFAQIKIKDPERIAYYGELMGCSEPTLADLLRSVVQDEHNSFEEFPVPVRPAYDFIMELRTATELPVLLAIDGWNRFHQMTSAKEWNKSIPLHAQQMMVPNILGDLHAFGSGMENGLLLCAVTNSSASPPGISKGLRKRWPQPYHFHRPQTLPEEMQRMLRNVDPYSSLEVQRALEFYAFAGHLQNPGLEAQLETGELRTKVSLMTGGVGSDIFKLCEQM